MTKAQKEALKWFLEHGGDGCFPERNRQVLLAQGERAPVMRSTWEVLIKLGKCERYGKYRMRITAGLLS